LHFGSLVAAVASYADALRHGGEWLVRMEDLDPPRCMPGAADDILRTLEALGFAWQGEVLFQGTRREAYEEMLDRLTRAGHTFPCACSRREVADSILGPHGEHVYPGTCRGGLGGRAARSIRVRVGTEPIEFDDAIQGLQRESLAASVGDFVLRRADGLFAYQLAVVTDDAAQGITHVVRGADLLGSTARQIWLQRLLGLPTLSYAHVPVVADTSGQKLSKQTRAPRIDPSRPAAALVRALEFLGQGPPDHLTRATAEEVWSWVREHGSLGAVPRVTSALQPDARV
jgi:glutamyl-Q tRNA(Asp) synthetase